MTSAPTFLLEEPGFSDARWPGHDLKGVLTLPHQRPGTNAEQPQFALQGNPLQAGPDRSTERVRIVGRNLERAITVVLAQCP